MIPKDSPSLKAKQATAAASGSTQLISAYRRVITHKCELSGFPEWMKDDVVKRPIRFEGGFVHVPDGAGLGVELDDEKLERYAKAVVSVT